MSGEKLGSSVQQVGITNIGFAIGIGWYAGHLYGFGWGIVYGLFWQWWLGYRLAAHLLG